MKPAPGDRQPVAVTTDRTSTGKSAVLVACTDGVVCRWSPVTGQWTEMLPIPGSAADRALQNEAERAEADTAPPASGDPPTSGDPASAQNPEPIEDVVTGARLVELFHDDGGRSFELDGKPVRLLRLWDDDGHEIDVINRREDR